MLHTFLSYLSRFSRLILVTLAVLVVIILLGFTIRSASDDEAAVSNESEVGTVVVEDTAVEGTSETAEGVTYDAESGTSQVVVVNESASASATTAETANPQLSGGTEINLDSSDTVTVVTLDEEGNIATESGHVSSTISGISGTLPSTGLADVLAVAVGLMALVGALGFYILSRQNLSTISLESNR